MWKVIEPLLDCRTASRVIWVTDGDMLRTELEGSFKKEDIPTWMGGSGGEGEQMKLFSGRMVDQKQLEGRFS